MQYKIGDILKRNEVGDYGEMWLEITSDGEEGLKGVLRNKDWELVRALYESEKHLAQNYTPAPDEIKVGDVLTDSRYEKGRRVLARIGEGCFLEGLLPLFTLKELKSQG